MKINLRQATSLIVMGFVMSGCVDENYDLSDIDKTVRVNVDNLVIPVNIEDIKLSNIFNIKEGDKIQIIDGEYVLSEKGSFTSDEINIESVRFDSPYIEPTETTIYLDVPVESRKVGRANDIFRYNIASESTSFNYEANEVSDYIHEIETVDGNLTLTVTISFSGISTKVKSFNLENVVIVFPKGLAIVPHDGQTFDPKTGEVSIPTTQFSGDKAEYTFEANQINFQEIDGSYDYETSKIRIAGEMYVKQGYITLSASDLVPGLNITDLPESIEMRNEYIVSEFEVTEFTGKIYYEVENLSISDVELNDIPGLLNQDGTDIRIANPQLYINVNNPLDEYNLYAESTLAITTYPRKGEPFTNAIDNGTFVIPCRPGILEYNFCMAPTMPSNPLAEYPDPEFIPFKGLGKVLSGDGIPSRLAIDINPNVPVQKVTNFKLGQNIGQVSGKYEFYAPLAFDDGSKIVYADTVTGWNSEDLDYLTIQRLEVNAQVSTNIPMGATLTGYPIDVDGNRINNVSIEGAEIDPMAKDQIVKIHITGEVTRLDGIIFRAVINSDGSEPLSPDMTISLSHLRPCVSGYYEKNLD